MHDFSLSIDFLKEKRTKNLHKHLVHVVFHNNICTALINPIAQSSDQPFLTEELFHAVV